MHRATPGRARLSAARHAPPRGDRRPARTRPGAVLPRWRAPARPSTVGLAGPARSDEWIVLCTGYDACHAAGYPNAGYKDNSATSYWRQSTGHNCTNYVAYRLVKNGLPNTSPPPVRQRLQLGSGLPEPDQRRPGRRVGRLVEQSFSSTGHVAYVEKVVSADEILVSEDNWGGDFRWRKITRSGGNWPDGFIHPRTWGPRSPPRPLPDLPPRAAGAHRRHPHRPRGDWAPPRRK